MEEFTGATIGARAFKQLVAEQREAVIVIGHSRSIRVYVLPAAKWQSTINEIYGVGEWLDQTRHVDIRALRDQATMARVTMDQSDEDWKPSGFLVVYADGVVNAFVVPANPYWRSKVEGGGAQ